MAYKAIPLLLRNVPNANDGKTFMDASFVSIPKLTTFAMSDILAVEHDPELTVMPIIPLGDLRSCNDGWGEWDDEDRDKNVLYMEGLIRGGHTFKKEEWPGGFAGLDVVDVDEKIAGVEHERHVVNRKATGEEVYESGKRVGKRKGRKLKSYRSKRKQQKIDNYFPPVLRPGRKMQEWVAEQIAKVRNTLTAKIEQQAEELTCLKKQNSGRKRRLSVDMVGMSVGRSGRFFRHCKTGRGTRDSGVGFAVGKGLIGSPSGETKGDSIGIGEDVTHMVGEDGFVDNKCDSSNGSADWCTAAKKGNETIESAAAEEFSCVADPPGVCAQADDVSRGHTMDLGPTHYSLDVGGNNPLDLVASEGGSPDVGSTDASLKEDRDLEEVLPDVESGKNSFHGKPLTRYVDWESVDEARELEEVRLAVNATVMGTIAMYSDKQEDKVVRPDGGDSSKEDGTPTVEVSDIAMAEDVQYMDEFEEFKATLEESEDMEHITKGGFVITSKFLLDLAEPEEWVSTTHMEVLMSMLKDRHADVLAAEKSLFETPWFINYLQGKYAAFSKAKLKERVRFDSRLTRYLRSDGKIWFDDVQTVYVPMCWEGKHWVGLAIHLSMWVVEIFDFAPSLYADRKVKRFMAPVLEMLSYVIAKVCTPTASQGHGLKAMSCKRVEGLYENTRSGDCGPVAVKFMELHLNGNPSGTMSYISDSVVDDFRKHYAMDIYQELVVPLYDLGE
ncbi:hypothetical protein AALP_AA6G173600 [Arabis alpina]|uniref:Ubiquitin-like protease family profile domain-containing protein n=1 Tax=Arabis alpina TaxID=50452 RepID=A0A087GPU7_ARAAL|nr:hypothetical protein AALP_AA6G173600 [Arabis alpina]